jgi:hypothetical protein
VVVDDHGERLLEPREFFKQFKAKLGMETHGPDFPFVKGA